MADFDANRDYPIKLGKTFRSKDKAKEKFVTIKYGFRSEGIDESKGGSLLLDDRAGATLTFSKAGSSTDEVVFQGNKKATKPIDMVMIFDPETESFVIERLSEAYTVQIKKLGSNAGGSANTMKQARPAKEEDEARDSPILQETRAERDGNLFGDLSSEEDSDAELQKPGFLSSQSQEKDTSLRQPVSGQASQTGSRAPSPMFKPQIMEFSKRKVDEEKNGHPDKHKKLKKDKKPAPAVLPKRLNGKSIELSRTESSSSSSSSGSSSSGSSGSSSSGSESESESDQESERATPSSTTSASAPASNKVMGLRNLKPQPQSREDSSESD